ncbi:hypothetical protein [Stenotrophomonas sp. MMGLT7]|uniref:hypothetical protein n=1 Tax=Stenotrophomonas sp. MMGLT7 TaxID=2901227 RepID=UPI001E5EEFC5|nr:hypothetical protein [Stenotrophomonas sp. MMGLT7]MCD7099087.1 hypothetical protein [Stenotrophomonas sp. MMGLT7]
MPIFTEGWPAIEGMVLKPERSGSWPMVTQAVLVPFKVQNEPVPELDTLQVVIVPRANWERLIAHVPPAVLAREGVQHG